MAFERKLSETQKAQIFEKAVKGARTKDLAEEYGVCSKTIAEIKYDPKRLTKYEKRLDAHQRFHRIRIHEGASKGIEKEHEILEREVPDGAKGVSLLYLQHQVASSLMDRDGLKAPDKSEQKIELTFSDEGFNVGMPDESVDVSDADEGAEMESDAE